VPDHLPLLRATGAFAVLPPTEPELRMLDRSRDAASLSYGVSMAVTSNSC
jgi:hypothetical protein